MQPITVSEPNNLIHLPWWEKIVNHWTPWSLKSNTQMPVFIVAGQCFHSLDLNPLSEKQQSVVKRFIKKDEKQWMFHMDICELLFFQCLPIEHNAQGCIYLIKNTVKTAVKYYCNLKLLFSILIYLKMWVIFFVANLNFHPFFQDSLMNRRSSIRTAFDENKIILLLL